MTRRRVRSKALLAAIAGVLSTLAAGTVAADGRGIHAPSNHVEPSAEVKAEARQRFDRGLALYNEGDLNGAFAEFRAAYRLTGHPVVLYNLALVHAGLGQAAEAVEALEKLLENGGSARAELGPERAERARKVHEEQLLRVGSLQIESDVERARVQIDNIDVASTPAPPLRVTAGTHVVSLSAPQHEPRRVSVTVAGRAVEVLEMNLTPLEEALAHLTLTSPVPDVAVRANGELLGRTPFSSNVALRPGNYELEFTRAGYVPVKRTLELGPGSTGHVDVPMVPSDGGLAAGGVLAFQLSETDAVVSVDGQPRLDHARGLSLPVGRHSVRVLRAGFFDVEREVWIRPGRQTLDVTLLPTPAHLDAYVRDAKSQRFYSYLTLAGGGIVTASAAGFLIWNQGQKNQAERDFNRYADEVAALPNGTCADAACRQKLSILVDELDERRRRDVFGWVGVALGGSALGLGAFFLARSPDPARYDPKPESDVFGALDLKFRGTTLEATGSF